MVIGYEHCLRSMCGLFLKYTKLQAGSNTHETMLHLHGKTEERSCMRERLRVVPQEQDVCDLDLNALRWHPQTTSQRVMQQLYQMRIE